MHINTKERLTIMNLSFSFWNVHLYIDTDSTRSPDITFLPVVVSSPKFHPHSLVVVLCIELISTHSQVFTVLTLTEHHLNIGLVESHFPLCHNSNLSQIIFDSRQFTVKITAQYLKNIITKHSHSHMNFWHQVFHIITRHEVENIFSVHSDTSAPVKSLRVFTKRNLDEHVRLAECLPLKCTSLLHD